MIREEEKMNYRHLSYGFYNLSQEDCDAMHPGFEIKCKCGSTRVAVDNSLGFSETSGQWGSIDLICCLCGHETSVYGED